MWVGISNCRPISHRKKLYIRLAVDSPPSLALLAASFLSLALSPRTFDCKNQELCRLRFEICSFSTRAVGYPCNGASAATLGLHAYGHLAIEQ